MPPWRTWSTSPAMQAQRAATRSSWSSAGGSGRRSIQRCATGSRVRVVAGGLPRGSGEGRGLPDARAGILRRRGGGGAPSLGGRTCRTREAFPDSAKWRVVVSRGPDPTRSPRRRRRAPAPCSNSRSFFTWNCAASVRARPSHGWSSGAFSPSFVIDRAADSSDQLCVVRGAVRELFRRIAARAAAPRSRAREPSADSDRGASSQPQP